MKSKKVVIKTPQVYVGPWPDTNLEELFLSACVRTIPVVLHFGEAATLAGVRILLGLAESKDASIDMLIRSFLLACRAHRDKTVPPGPTIYYSLDSAAADMCETLDKFRAANGDVRGLSGVFLTALGLLDGHACRALVKNILTEERV